MKFIVKGIEVLIDKDDFDKINKWKWKLLGWYIGRNHWNKELKKYESMMMHRYISNTPIGYDTDHKNKNKFDNRKCNLRTFSRSENMHNVNCRSTNTSGIKGVSYHKQSNKWVAYIWVNYIKISLGLHINIREAAKARKKAEIKYFPHIYK